jgi:hypothetical protein
MNSARVAPLPLGASNEAAEMHEGSRRGGKRYKARKVRKVRKTRRHK